MDPQVPTSFIPKKPLVEGRRGGSFGLVFLLALLIFLGSIAAAGAAFLYGVYLQNALTAKARSLETAQGAFESAGTIETLIRLDSRINQAKDLLAAHVAPSAIFFFLSAQTLEKVRFTSFDYAIKDNGGATIELKGVTDSFATIALQSDQFGASQVLRNIIFSDIAVQPEGGVTFSLTATVDPALLLYKNNLTQEPFNIPPPTQSTTGSSGATGGGGSTATTTSATTTPETTQ